MLAADDGFFCDAERQAAALGQRLRRTSAPCFDAVSTARSYALVDPSVAAGRLQRRTSSTWGVEGHRRPLRAVRGEYTRPDDRPRGDGHRHRRAGIRLDAADHGRRLRQRSGVPAPSSASRVLLRTYVKLNDGVNAKHGARSNRVRARRQGVQAESIRELLDEAAAQNNAFIRMFQGFMALGLLAGIAALGVIAFRSVVERRQQIGMLRAIGYQTGTVALTFVLESGFIALMGILSGVVGGMIIAHNLFTTRSVRRRRHRVRDAVDGDLLFTGVALVVSMFMTWWPSRQAARGAGRRRPALRVA